VCYPHPTDVGHSTADPNPLRSGVAEALTDNESAHTIFCVAVKLPDQVKRPAKNLREQPDVRAVAHGIGGVNQSRVLHEQFAIFGTTELDGRDTLDALAQKIDDAESFVFGNLDDRRIALLVDDVETPLRVDFVGPAAQVRDRVLVPVFETPLQVEALIEEPCELAANVRSKDFLTRQAENENLVLITSEGASDVQENCGTVAVKELDLILTRQNPGGVGVRRFVVQRVLHITHSVFEGWGHTGTHAHQMLARHALCVICSSQLHMLSSQPTS
jgi:hypothetical protein